MPEPGDALTWLKAAHILDRSLTTVARLVAAGELSKGPRWEHRQLSRSDVEAVSLRRWNRHTAGSDSYWLGTKEAAELLGVNRGARQAVDRRWAVAFEWTPDGHRASRREQLATVANARRARFHAYDIGL